MVSKERRKEILERLEKATSEEYKTDWNDQGLPVSKKKSKISEGKKSRQKGSQFELFVRKDLEKKDWIVDKWSNNVDLEEQKVVQAKRKFNPFSKVMTIGTGFPDFIVIKNLENDFFEVVGVEVKVNGTLSKEEKEKCRFLLDKKVFKDVWIAIKKKDGKKNVVEYINFRERYK